MTALFYPQCHKRGTPTPGPLALHHLWNKTNFLCQFMNLKSSKIERNISILYTSLIHMLPGTNFKTRSSPDLTLEKLDQKRRNGERRNWTKMQDQACQIGENLDPERKVTRRVAGGWWVVGWWWWCCNGPFAPPSQRWFVLDTLSFKFALYGIELIFWDHLPICTPKTNSWLRYWNATETPLKVITNF